MEGQDLCTRKAKPVKPLTITSIFNNLFPLYDVDAKRVIVAMSIGKNWAAKSLTNHEISLRRMCGNRMVVISEKQDAGLKRVTYLAPSWARLCDVWDLIDVTVDRWDMWLTPVSRYCNDLIDTLVVDVCDELTESAYVIDLEQPTVETHIRNLDITSATYYTRQVDVLDYYMLDCHDLFLSRLVLSSLQADASHQGKPIATSFKVVIYSCLDLSCWATKLVAVIRENPLPHQGCDTGKTHYHIKAGDPFLTLYAEYPLGKYFPFPAYRWLLTISGMRPADGDAVECVLAVAGFTHPKMAAALFSVMLLSLFLTVHMLYDSTVYTLEDAAVMVSGTAALGQSRVHFPRTSRRLPQAIIVGIRKCGTRALLEMLALHPHVQKAAGEVHFFDRDDNYRKGLEWYRRKMPHSFKEQITIEKSPSYFVTPEGTRTESNPDLPTFSSLVQHESSALDHVATEASKRDRIKKVT
uniref:Sulfotransferase domain-containing protein n=1 Tax=Timema bartmani TaxID=61472 RepID=A0A7R9F8I1_9NEOP|nr:unnamed protein product [Timema bartmani]